MLGAPATGAKVAGRLDATSLALAAALAAWTALVAGGGEGRSTPILLLLGALVAAVAVGRRLACWPGVVTSAVAVAVASAFVVTYPGLLGAGGAPTGYANSNATLGAIGVVAAVASARRAPAGRERQAWAALAAALVAATLLTESVAGIIVLSAVSALWLLASRLRWPPLVAAGGAVGVSLALAFTVAMAVDDSVPWSDTDAVRVELWSAAADLVDDAPLRGLGAGAFEDRSPVSGDRDLRWAHHEYLELAVELGGVGLLLAVALGLTVLARLTLAGVDGSAAAAAVTIVAAHGTVDHVWHAPVLLVLVALVVGDATGVDPRRSRTRSVAEEPAEWVRRAIAGDVAEG